MNDASSNVPRSAGLAPVIDDNIRILVLGSLPGVRSLQAQHYYAHPRNAFWPIMSEMLGIELPAEFARRYEVMLAQHIGLWDVVESSRRAGSLDSAIQPAYTSVNSFEPILRRCIELQVIAFNGKKAREIFDRRVLPGLFAARIPLLLTLPSTSPAHAAMPQDEKQRRWFALQAFLSGPKNQNNSRSE